YSHITIDGVSLDPAMVRFFMAQNTMPHLTCRVVSADCPSCHHPKFSSGQMATTPVIEQVCERCGREFAAHNRFRKTVANPIVDVLRQLSDSAPRPAQRHDMGLLPETL